MVVDGIAVLDEIEAYLDAAPRLAATAEPHGPLTLFVGVGGGPGFYARPMLGHRGPISAADVGAVRERQRALHVPEAFEWVRELAPSMASACQAAGLQVIDHPLLRLGRLVPPEPPAGATTTVLTADSADTDLANALAVPPVAFGAADGSDETPPTDDIALDAIAGLRRRYAEGTLRTAVARIDGTVVAVASAIPVDGVAEVVAVATLPQARRRGLASMVTALAVEAAADLGASTIFLSAGDRGATRLYERLGFRRVATASVAAPGASQAGQ